MDGDGMMHRWAKLDAKERQRIIAGYLDRVCGRMDEYIVRARAFRSR